MTDLLTRLDERRRAPLLIRAARIGLGTYCRDATLRRLLQCPQAPGNRAALGALMALEEEAEEARKKKAAGYSPARHVDLLIAIMGEARLMRAARP